MHDLPTEFFGQMKRNRRQMVLGLNCSVYKYEFKVRL